MVNGAAFVRRLEVSSLGVQWQLFVSSEQCHYFLSVADATAGTTVKVSGEASHGKVPFSYSSSGGDSFLHRRIFPCYTAAAEITQETFLGDHLAGGDLFLRENPSGGVCIATGRRFGSPNNRN